MHGQYFAINGVRVTSPDEEKWSNYVVGESLVATQRRSPYQKLEWSVRVADKCHLDWSNYDNQQLTSLICTPPNKVDEFEEYTDATLQSVAMRKRHANATDIVATFLVLTA